MSVKSTVAARPAESATGAVGLLAGAIIAITNATPEVAGLVTAGVGVLAAAVTYLRTHGGFAGVWNSLVHGEPAP
ncbi:MAG: hypothetical protein ABIU97_10240 [Dehalococcoidia bacterium]